jgi:hypothetical protein
MIAVLVPTLVSEDCARSRRGQRTTSRSTIEADLVVYEVTDPLDGSSVVAAVDELRCSRVYTNHTTSIEIFFTQAKPLTYFIVATPDGCSLNIGDLLVGCPL